MLKSCTYNIKDTTRVDISRKGASCGVSKVQLSLFTEVLRWLKIRTEGPGITNGDIQMKTAFHDASATIADCRGLSWQNSSVCVSQLRRSASVARSLNPKKWNPTVIGDNHEKFVSYPDFQNVSRLKWQKLLQLMTKTLASTQHSLTQQRSASQSVCM